MSYKTNISQIIANVLDLDVINEDIIWKSMRLSGGDALVPDQALCDTIEFDWLKDRLLPLINGGVVKIEDRYYEVGLPRRKDVKHLKQHLSFDITFWVKSTNPRKATIGPRGGLYDRLADEDELSISLVPVLYEIKTLAAKTKSMISLWKRAFMRVVKKIKVKVGAFFSEVRAFCKGYRSTHTRSGHWREIGPEGTKEAVWVKACLVRGHYYGETV